jgi:glycosyltransferase involved in cell wall biosynthesis
LPTPRLSIITPVHNAGPVLRETIDSVLEQTCRDIEHILVDDGSTDESAAILAEYAERHESIVVDAQPASGSAGPPRNLALDKHARGEFVFFLDADDRLAPDAAESMLAAADESGSDIVLCRMESFGHASRSIPRAVFREERRAADFVECFAYRTLGPWKMFRRSLLETHRIRFETDYRNGEDLPFTMKAYLAGNHVSAVSDHVYYWLRNIAPDDGRMKNASKGGQPPADDMKKNLAVIRAVRAGTEPGARRDLLLERSFLSGTGLHLCFNARFPKLPRPEQEDLVRRVQEVKDLWPSLRRSATDKLRTVLDAAFTGRTDEVVRAIEATMANAWVLGSERVSPLAVALYVERRGKSEGGRENVEVTAGGRTTVVAPTRLTGEVFRVEVPRLLASGRPHARFVPADVPLSPPLGARILGSMRRRVTGR